MITSTTSQFIFIKLLCTSLVVVLVLREWAHYMPMATIDAQERRLTSEEMSAARDLRRNERRQSPHPPFPLTSLDFERIAAASPLQAERKQLSSMPQSVDGSSGRQACQPHQVCKTIFSDAHRLVFFAGIEGTGHHFWTAVFGDSAISKLLYFDDREFGVASTLWQVFSPLHPS